MSWLRAIHTLFLGILIAATLAACSGGGGSGSDELAASDYAVRGSVTGLAPGETVVITLKAGAVTEAVNAAAVFSFDNRLTKGTAYTVTAVAPAGKTCTVTGGSGTVGTSDVAVSVSCSTIPVGTPDYAVGGTVTGLGAGETVALTLSAAPVMETIDASAGFSFSHRLIEGTAYTIGAMAPAGKTCAVTGGSGTVGTSDVTVSVSCSTIPVGTPDYAVGGAVSGLGAGETVALTLKAGSVTEIANANAGFSFTNRLTEGTAYTVTATAPAGKSCAVTGGSGTVGTSDVTVTVSCSAVTYAVGGTVTGLGAGETVALTLNAGSATETINTGAGFSFTNRLTEGTAYTATAAAPAGKTCAVTGGSGTVGTSDVTITVSCSAATYAVGGTVTGLGAGETVALTLNAGSVTEIANANAGFSFTSRLTEGTAYSVTATAPAGKTCAVTGGGNGDGSGNISGADVSNVTVNCVAMYSVGGAVSGLSGTLVLKNNGGDDLSISANGGFAFSTKIADGSPYSVSVATQPAGQRCTVTNAAGSISGADVSGVAVNCVVAKYSVGGAVSGLSGTLVLKNNGGDNLTISADDGFTFPTKLIDGSRYSVSVATQPAGQTCNITNATDYVSGADVTSVTVSCTDAAALTIGGTVSGLVGEVILRLGSEYLTVTSNGSFTFAQPVADGKYIRVNIDSQPNEQICEVYRDGRTVSGASITDVSVTCSTITYKLGGTVSGLDTMYSVVLQDNVSGSKKTVTGNGSFSFYSGLPNGSTYEVTVLTQPFGQSCTVAGASGTIAGADVNSVTVTCGTASYTVGGTVSGLSGTLVLQDNGGDDLTLNADGSFNFPTEVVHKGVYEVTVLTQPEGQTCTVGGASGTVYGADITDVAVTCSKSYSVGGSVSGLSGTLVLQDNGGDDLTLSADGGFSFPTKLADGSAYKVTVLTQPAGQSCTVSGASGAIAGADVTSVGVSCTALPFKVGGSISGLTGTLVLRNNGGDNLTFNADGSFSFPTSVLSGDTYNVTVADEPLGLHCSVSKGSGTVAAADVTDVAVDCAPATTYSITGSMSGMLSSTTVWLKNNSRDTLAVYSDGRFAFETQVNDGAPYDVTVSASPGYLCQVNNASGTVSGGTVGDVTVDCMAAPNPSVSGYTHGFELAWPASANADFYRVMVNPGGVSGFTQDGPDISTADTSGYYRYSHDVSAHIFDWWNDQYVVEACNAQGCVGGDPVDAHSAAAQTAAVIEGGRYPDPGDPLDPGDKFGRDIAVNGAGDLFVAGAPLEDGDATGVNGNENRDNVADSGAAFVFSFDHVTNQWVEQAYLKPSTTTPSLHFGISVAMSQDGNTIAVGAEDSAAAGGINSDELFDCTSSPTVNCAEQSGAVYVFTRSNTGTWRQQARIKAAHPVGTKYFGRVISLSADGNVLAVGSLFDSTAASGINGDQVSDCGSPSANNCKSASGAAFVFARDDAGTWSQQAYIKSSYPDAGDYFGSQVRLSGDGATLAVSAENDDSANTLPDDCSSSASSNCTSTSGAVYVFIRDEWMNWTQQAFLKRPGACPDEYMGRSMTMSGDGNVIGVGLVDAHSGTNFDISGGCSKYVYGSNMVATFRRDGDGTWAHEASFKAPLEAAWLGFGKDVALNEDASMLFVNIIASGGTKAVSTADEVSTQLYAPPADHSKVNPTAVLLYRSDPIVKWKLDRIIKSPVLGDFGFTVETNDAGDRLLGYEGRSGVIIY